MRRNVVGSACVELSCGMILLPLIAAFLLNICLLVISSSLGDLLVKDMARAAAAQASREEAATASNQVFAGFKRSPLITKVSADELDYGTAGCVTARARITVRLPAGIQGAENVTLKFAATEPLLIN